MYTDQETYKHKKEWATLPYTSSQPLGTFISYDYFKRKPCEQRKKVLICTVHIPIVKKLYAKTWYRCLQILQHYVEMYESNIIINNYYCVALDLHNTVKSKIYIAICYFCVFFLTSV